MNEEEKYIRFYQSVKDFILKTHLSFDNEIEGETLSAINTFENDYRIEFPMAVFYYLLFFGKKITVRKTEVDFFTLNDIKEAMEVAERYDYRKALGRKEGLQDYNGNDGDIKYVYQFVNLDKLIFINDRDYVQAVRFVDTTDDNPDIHYFFQKAYYLGANLNFTNFIRNVLFLAIKGAFYANNWRPAADLTWLNIEGIDWAQNYVKLTDKNIVFPSILTWRLEFYEVVSQQEKEDGNMMTVDEFEWAFIAYLRKQGHKI